MSQIVNCYSLLLLSQLQQTERVVERQARLWPDNEKLEPDESKQEGEENADVVQVGTVGGSTGCGSDGGGGGVEGQASALYTK